MQTGSTFMRYDFIKKIGEFDGQAISFPRLWFAALLGGVFFLGEIQAVGFGFEYQSAAISAEGNTGVTNRESASLIHYNPGALVWLKNNTAEINFSAINASGQWEQNGTTYEPNDNTQFAGSAYIASPVEIAEQKFILGLGITNAYGLASEWPSSVPAANTGAGFEGSLELPQLQFSAAYQITSKLGVGVTINRMDGELESAGTLNIPANAENRFIGTGEGSFLQYGVSYQFNEKWNFGLAYRDRFEVNFEGELTTTLASNTLNVSEASSSLAFPAHVIFGANYRGYEKWSLSWQSQWTEWSEVEAFNLSTPLGSANTPVNWEDGWIHSLGASYEVNENMTIRGGYMYAESVIPDETQTLTHNDFAQHFFSYGIGLDNEQWGLDLTYIYVLSEDQSISGNVYSIDGEHESEGYFLNAGIRYKF